MVAAALETSGMTVQLLPEGERAVVEDLWRSRAAVQP
jgi:hypothetical protein